MKTILTVFALFLTLSLAAQSSKTDTEKLVGKWVSHDDGYPMEADFKANGSAVVDGDAVTWSLKPGTLVLGVEGEKKSYAISFSENAFRVSGGDLEKPMNFKRITGSGAAAAPVPAANATGKKLDPTLAGKWCYVNVASNYSTSSEQCIIVNANGTYEYYAEGSTSGSNGSTASQSSDAGTWWVEGNRVYYNSQNQGEGSYELVKKNHPKTGDPMIVLDGTAYVTFYKKSPW
ncbi:MAG TPA: hypothetical protein VGD65_08915 [Chryseosolibacter sp.]